MGMKPPPDEEYLPEPDDKRVGTTLGHDGAQQSAVEKLRLDLFRTQGFGDVCRAWGSDDVYEGLSYAVHGANAVDQGQWFIGRGGVISMASWRVRLPRRRRGEGRSRSKFHYADEDIA